MITTMRKILDIQKYILVWIFIGMISVSCSENALDDINRDRNHSTDINAKFILSDVITRTAFNIVGGDFSTYLSSYVEHEVGVDNQLWSADTRVNEPSAASTFNNVWSTAYTNLKNARIAIGKCSEGGVQEGNNSSKGIAEILAAINAAILTDMFGDIPYSEAALIKPDGSPQVMNPKIDKQEEVYKDIMRLLDAAITDLNTDDKAGSEAIGSYDFLYNGDKSKWIKLAYGLKARYTMRLMLKSSNVVAEMDKVLEYANKSFASSEEEAAFNVYSGTNINPLYDFYSAREALGASKSLVDKFAERNDPRMRRSFATLKGVQVTGRDDATFVIAPNGTSEESKTTYSTSIFVHAQSASTMIMSYHELLFLKAEAYARKNMLPEAQAQLKQAVIAGIANAEKSIATTADIKKTSDPITTAEATTYFDTRVQPLFTANPLKEVMLQKYLAFFGASGESTECYSDIRRWKALNQDFIVLDNPKNKEGKFPLRCPYGTDDTTANPNVQEAYGNGQYVYTENVWWAGGNR